MKKGINNLVVAVLADLLVVSVVIAQPSVSKVKAHNKIDDVSSPAEIEGLLKSVDPYFSTFHVNESLDFQDKNCSRLSDSLHCTPWFKADFDNNGYTDLAVVGGWDDHAVVCLMDSGNNRFAINRLTRKIFQNYTLPVLKEIGNNDAILYYSIDERRRDSVETDTLVYKFKDFVEYNPSVKNYDIQKIEITTDQCYGDCPQFSMVINGDHTAEYNAIHFNKKTGDFEGVIDDSSYTELVKLLDYIDFPSLQNNYRVNWHYDQNAVLKITYNNGQQKIIHDEGLHGTFGLERVYRVLFAFRDNQEWTEMPRNVKQQKTL